MNERPSGTVTFLFTDIEGSTRLWEHHHSAMKTALSVHDRIVRGRIETHGGYVFSTGGDSFSAAFPDPIDAAVAALDIHRDLDEHDWGEVEELRVRAAIDTGLADERDGDYFGPPLNRVARILGHAHGGDTLCSHTTADLLKHDLPGEYSVVKLGRRRLKGVEDTEMLFRIAQPDEAALRPRWVTAVVIVAGLAAVGVGWWSIASSDDGEADRASSDTLNTGTTTEARTATSQIVDDSGVLWSQPVGDVTAGPLVLGEMVVAATDETVSAFDLEDGEPRWARAGFERIRSLNTDGEYLFISSAQRLDVLHPQTGDLVPRCGFALPVTFARTNVIEDDVFIMVGSLFRVVTDPGGERCHGPVTENAGSMSGLDPTAGPVHTGHVVVAADAVGVYAFDPRTLDLMWRYPDRSEPAIAVHPPSLVAADFEQRIRTSSTSSTVVALTDDKGILVVLNASDGSVRPMPSPAIRTNRDRPIVITEHAVVVVNAQDELIGIDPESGDIRWTVDDVAVTAGPLETDAWILVATADQLIAIDPIDGSTVRTASSSVTPIGVAADGQAAVVIDSDQTMHGIALSWADPAPTWRPPPDPTPGPDPETVARRFIDAWNSGDREAVERLIGVDVRFLVTGLREIWSTRARAMLWTWFDGDQVLESDWSLGSCTTETVGSNTSAVTCSSTYTDVVTEASGVDLEGFATQITITNGVVTKVIAGGNVSRPGEGGVFTDFGGRWVQHDRFDDWAAVAHPAEHATACQTADAMGPMCAAFTVAHVDEWAETLGS